MKSNTAVFVFLTIIVILGTGYIKNIIKLASCDFEAPYKAEIIYGIGTVAPPIGAVTGWINIGK